MKAKIVDGIIQSIGDGKDIKHEIPAEINFINFKNYACINEKESSKMSSWIPIADFLEIKRKEQEALEAKRQEEEKIRQTIIQKDLEEMARKNAVRKLTIPRIIVTIFFLLSLVGAYVVQGEADYVIWVSVGFVLFASLVMQQVWKKPS